MLHKWDTFEKTDKYEEKCWSPEQLSNLFGAASVIIPVGGGVYAQAGAEVAFELVQRGIEEIPGDGFKIRHYKPLPLFKVVGRCSIPDEGKPLSQKTLVDEDYNNLTNGQALPGWTNGVEATNGDFHSAPMGAKVTTNIPAAFTSFALTQGEIIFDLWMRPDNPNINLSFHIVPPHSDWGILFWAGDDGNWWYHQRPSEGPQQVDFGNYDGSWHHFRVYYSTLTNRYDLCMDGTLVGDDVLWLYDGSAGISKVGFNCNGETGYFDDLKVYVK